MNAGRIASLALACALSLAGCGDRKPDAPQPAPGEISAEAVGHYCGMNLVEHTGPKGQIFLEGKSSPVWFTAIKQVFAYTLLPEEPKAILAIYVNDMGKADNWDQPDASAWIEARQAWYVIESSYVGGMGVEDALPFGERQWAQDFAAAHGGRVTTFQDMPESYIWRQGAEAAPGDSVMENH
jgi:copper chaperone NosL